MIALVLIKLIEYIYCCCLYYSELIGRREVENKYFPVKLRLALCLISDSRTRDVLP